MTKNNLLVDIGGLIYKVEYEDHLARDSRASGRSCGNALRIMLDASLPPDQLRTTLLHEIIEQIDYRYELDLGEHRISVLEAALYQVIRANPEVMAYIEGG